MSDMKRTKEQQQNADNLFDAFRDDLLKRELSNTENYDKTILTLSSSSLAFSLTAIKFVIPIATATHVGLLKSAWALLTFSMVFSIFAYIIGNKALGIELEKAREYYKHGVEEAISRKNWFTSINAAINLFIGISLAIAICSIVLFIGINIETGEA